MGGSCLRYINLDRLMGGIDEIMVKYRAILGFIETKVSR